MAFPLVLQAQGKLPRGFSGGGHVFVSDVGNSDRPCLLQLIRECKEVLLGSVMVKQYYQQMVVAVTAEEHSREKCETDLEAFEEDMKDMLEVRGSHGGSGGGGCNIPVYV